MDGIIKHLNETSNVHDVHQPDAPDQPVLSEEERDDIDPESPMNVSQSTTGEVSETVVTAASSESLGGISTPPRPLVEPPAHEPISNSPEDAQSPPRSRPQRTRRPPTLLSYYSFGQPISSQARVSNIHSAVQPVPQFSYRPTHLQSRIQESYQQHLYIQDILMHLYHRDNSDTLYRQEKLDPTAKNDSTCLMLLTLSCYLNH